MEHESQSWEEHSDRAFRLTEKVRGILAEELAAFGGAEAFLRWVRSDCNERWNSESVPPDVL